MKWSASRRRKSPPPTDPPRVPDDLYVAIGQLLADRPRPEIRVGRVSDVVFAEVDARKPEVVAMIGHVHGHGIAVEATNESQGGKSICRSTAKADPNDLHRVLAMSSCTGDPLAVVQTGQTVRLHSEYQSSHAADDVMGIMLGNIYRT